MSEYLNLLGWAFLPQLATNFIQTFYYKIAYPVGANVPKKGQRKYVRHHSRIYILVVLAYLAYTIFEVDQSIQPNYYEFLNVKQNFTAKEVKTNFRKLQLLYHPDKNSDIEAEATFILIRTAHDTLTDSVKRFAYDRFGPQINGWDDCKTKRDYINHGWFSFVNFYLGTGLVLLILNILGKGLFGRFWKFLAFFATACLEAIVILHRNPPIILSFFASHRVRFEQIIILRQVFITTSIGLSQVGPVLFPSKITDLHGPLQQLEALSDITDEEAVNLLRIGFEPLARNQQAREKLKRNMENLAADSYLSTDPKFNKTYSHAYKRILKRRVHNN